MSQEPEGQNHVGGTIAGQTFSLTSKDLVPVLLLLVAGVAGYLVFLAMDAHLSRSDAIHLEIYKAVQAHDDHLDAKVDKLMALMQDQNDKLAHQTDQIRVMLLSVDYNIGRKIEERIPLELGAVLRQQGVTPKGRENLEK